jgi:lysophospholipase L1-like esterase
MTRRARFILAVAVLATGQFALAKLARADDAHPVLPRTVIPVDRQPWIDHANAITARAHKGDVDLLFVGDSITEGWGNNAVWKKYYGHRKAMNAGIGGDRTQHVLWRLARGNLDNIKPKLAVVMIGTNNAASDSSEDIAAGIKAVVHLLRTKLPETKVLLLGIFPRGAKPDDRLRQVNAKANALAKSVADDKMVFYLDIGDKFLEPDGTLTREIMPDLLHPNLRGYEIWAEAIEPKVKELMGEK